MSGSVSQSESKARISINKAGWRLVAGASVVIAVSLVGAVVAQVSFSDTSPADPLTTLTLVLAVLAFLVQIFVFVFQSNSSNGAVIRSEELNAQTRGVLSKIEATSSATQKVLFSQFDRLLDYVVDGKPSSPPRPQTRDVESFEEGSEEDEVPLTRSDIANFVSDAVAHATQRPTFSEEASAPSPENLQVLQYLKSWPEQSEAEAAVRVVGDLSPLALALYVRFGTAEVSQRSEGRPVGLGRPTKALLPAIDELLERSLIRRFGKDQFRMTDEGRAHWRILPFFKEGVEPDWLQLVVKPLSSSRSS